MAKRKKETSKTQEETKEQISSRNTEHEANKPLPTKATETVSHKKECEEKKENDNVNENPVIDPLIDLHVTVMIEDKRYDAIVEEKKNDNNENIECMYKVKFDDASYFGDHKWVKPNQILKQEIATSDKFQINDNVQVRENGDWMDGQDVLAKVAQIYQGATGIIVKLMFPEIEGDFYMYKNAEDVRKC